MKPDDINERIDLRRVDKKNLISVFDSHPEELAEEFKDVERDIDPEIGAPMGQQKKTHVVGRQQIARSINMQRSFKHLKKYREHK